MKIYMLCVDDERDVLEAVERDLSELEDVFLLESAESVDEALGLIQQIHAAGDRVGLILCDHVMPKKNGVDFLIELQNDPSTRPLRKILLTGQAGLDATVAAVNQAGLNYYVAKPWQKEELLRVCVEQLTDFILELDMDFTPWIGRMDPAKVEKSIRQGGLPGDS